MLVYNVARCWFPMKNDAEAYRKQLGLPKDALSKLVIDDRDQLAALLNGLVGLVPEERPPTAPVEPAPAPPEVLSRNRIEVPDFIPKFLVESWAKLLGGSHEFQTQESSVEDATQSSGVDQLAR